MCSVCIADNGTSLSEATGKTENDHAAQLTNLIDEALQGAGKGMKDLNAVAVSGGPGSYTGLRIGVSTAKGICHALNIPIIHIPTLQAMSVGASTFAKKAKLFCPLIDARRDEVFTAVYSEQAAEVLPPQSLILSEAFFRQFENKDSIVFFGSGLLKSRPLIKMRNAVLLEDYFHRSAFLSGLSNEKFRAGQFENLAYYEPYYLKPVYTTTKNSTEKQ